MSKNSGQPFGRPFQYTDDLPFLTEKRPWYKKFRRSKSPVAYVVPDEGDVDQLVAAFMAADDREVRVSPVEPQFIIPVYKDETVLGFVEKANEQTDKDG